MQMATRLGTILFLVTVFLTVLRGPASALAVDPEKGPAYLTDSHGATGVVLGLAVAGRYLDDDDITRAAKKVADYIAHRAVHEGGGLKFAQFHPLPK